MEEGQTLKSIGSWTPSCPPWQLSAPSSLAMVSTVFLETPSSLNLLAGESNSYKSPRLRLTSDGHLVAQKFDFLGLGGNLRGGWATSLDLRLSWTSSFASHRAMIPGLFIDYFDPVHNFSGLSLSTMLCRLKMADGMSTPKPRRGWKLVHKVHHLLPVVVLVVHQEQKLLPQNRGHPKPG